MEEKQELFRKKIIKNLYYSNSLSCAELSSKINKSLPVTTKLLSGLIKDQYIVETGFAPSTGGRKPAMYAMKSNVLYVVSVAMDQFVSRIAIMNMWNEYVTPVEKFELPLMDNPNALSVLIEKIESVIAASGISKNKIAGIGIGMPGFVDVSKGINHSFIPTKDKSITATVFDKIGIPTYIDNDSSLIALAELRFGAARGKKNVMVVNAGWGIGLGMILNGELFRGNNGFAGEFSHIPLFSNGKLCHCGKKGCLETEASLLVVIEKAWEGLRAGQLSKLKALPVEHSEEASEIIINAAYEGDQFAISLLSDAGYKIGRGVAILIHLMNPEIVLLSGRGSSAGRIWQAPIQQAINEHCIPRLGAQTTVEISTLGYEAELIGAAVLVMENYAKQSVGKPNSATRALQYSNN
jgi:predicted NBD/HSP70 family sugar kinase